jgi:hypothetical protein
MEFLIKLLLGLIGATSISLCVAIAVLLILKAIVYTFELNYGRDAYWVFTVTNTLFAISWIVSFGYFMSVIK